MRQTTWGAALTVFFLSRAAGAVGDGGGRWDDGAELFPELLSFAGRAQALISELLSVSEGALFFYCSSYGLGASYLDNPDDFEARINGSRELQSLEDELRESCSAFFQRFFLLASGITNYHEELLKYLEDLQVGRS
ncbi:unnamed protein product [Spirodela intermedia]|uniref:Uncharacterized protein n=1 Tax=Spirodela intermedia TaxID=51605 RepID=A0A7I8JCE4_SPIIN|nr:unnamed protein product [Spirodela intermedia]CAA6667824.1 unnamed protein product [Spirodela intermedia]